MSRSQGDNVNVPMIDHDDHHELLPLPQIPLLDIPLCPSSPRDLRRARRGIVDNPTSTCSSTTHGEPTCARFVPVLSTITTSAGATPTMERNSSRNHSSTSTRSSLYLHDDATSSSSFVYATPTRNSYRTNRCHPTTAIRRGCSSGNSAAAATVVNGTTFDHTLTNSSMGGRVRSGTWSGTSSTVLEGGYTSLHPSDDAATTTSNTISSSGGMDVPDQALIRGDLSWICRQCPHISGSVSMQLNLNVSRMKRFVLAFLYLAVMSVCFNVAFQKIVTMKEPFFFLDKSGPYTSATTTPYTPADSTERRSVSKSSIQGNDHDLRLNHKESLTDNTNMDSSLPNSYPLPMITDTQSITNAQNKPEFHTATFYAKAGIKRPLYSGGESVALVTSSYSKAPSTTNAFFGLIAVICLTSAIFVKGLQEAHTRWNEVRRRYEQSRQALIASAMESSSNAYVGA